jgi:hypothetical protein
MRDAQLTFYDAAITLAAGTNYTDIIDLGQQAFPIGNMVLYAQMIEAATSGGSATVQFVLQKDTTAAFPSATTVYDSGAIAVATLVDDYVIKEAVMQSLAYAEAAGSDTFLRFGIIVADADLTAGSVLLCIKSDTSPVKTKT